MGVKARGNKHACNKNPADFFTKATRSKRKRELRVQSWQQYSEAELWAKTNISTGNMIC